MATTAEAMRMDATTTIVMMMSTGSMNHFENLDILFSRRREAAFLSGSET